MLDDSPSWILLWRCIGAALTVGLRYAPQFLGGGWQSFQLLKPFSEVRFWSSAALLHCMS